MQSPLSVSRVLTGFVSTSLETSEPALRVPLDGARVLTEAPACDSLPFPASRGSLLCAQAHQPTIPTSAFLTPTLLLLSQPFPGLQPQLCAISSVLCFSAFRLMTSWVNLQVCSHPGPPCDYGARLVTMTLFSWGTGYHPRALTMFSMDSSTECIPRCLNHISVVSLRGPWGCPASENPSP